MDGGRIPVVCGPTGAGKSAIALHLAELAGRALISADSRQVYRGFDIGTAKPSPEERRRVMHYGVDCVEPADRYSAASFARDAELWIGESEARGVPTMIVGGTGFYIRALVDPLADSPAFDTVQRRSLSSELEELPVTELRRWCEVLDPELAHLGPTQMLRAVETALLSGRRLSEFQAAGPKREPFRAAYLVVDPGPQLTERIERRFDAMVEAGWLEEVRALTEQVPDDAPAWSGTGYQFMRAWVRGEMDAAGARAGTLTSTRQYAKRQRTWFRHQLPEADVTRVDSSAPDALSQAERWLESVS